MSEPSSEAENESDPFALDDGDDAETDSAELDLDDGEETEEEKAAAALEKKRFEDIQATREEELRAERAAAARAAARSEVPQPAAPARVELLARIKPFNAKKGQTMRTHSFNHNGTRVKFVEGHGWYAVDHSLAARLRQVRCSDMDPESNLAFDVCSATEARKVEAREEAALEQETRSPARRPRSAVG